MIDAYGNAKYVKQRGALNVTKHQSVLTALEKRAVRFQNSKSYEDVRDQELIDSLLKEDETVATADESLSDSDEGCQSLSSETTTQLEI